MSSLYSYGKRCSINAGTHSDKTAFVYAPAKGADVDADRDEPDSISRQFARQLKDRGAGEGSAIIIVRATCSEHYSASFGTWKTGSCVWPLKPGLPAKERLGRYAQSCQNQPASQKIIYSENLI